MSFSGFFCIRYPFLSKCLLQMQKCRKLNLIPNLVLWWTKVLKAVCERDWHMVRSSLFFNMQTFRTRISDLKKLTSRSYQPQTFSVGLVLNFDLMSFQTDFLTHFSLSFSLSLSQVICNQMQRVPGEDCPHRVRDAGARVCVPPQLFLLLCMWPTAEERGWVCTEGRTAAVQERLWEGERPPRLCQPRWLRFRYEYRLIYKPQTLMPAYSWIYF